MAIKPCPKCGESISDQSKKCVYCGEKVYTCPECGEFILASNECCPKCGNPIPEEATAEKVIEAPKQPEQKFDSKELLTEWKNSSKFAKFSLSVWRPIQIVFTILWTVAIVIVFIVCCVTIFSNINSSERAVFMARGFKLLLSWLIITSIVFLVFNICSTLLGNYFRIMDLSNWIKTKGYDPHLLTKHALDEITIEGFLSTNKKLANRTINWFKIPSHVIAEAAYLVAQPEAKTAYRNKIIVSCVLGPINLLGSIAFYCIFTPLFDSFVLVEQGYTVNIDSIKNNAIVWFIVFLVAELIPLIVNSVLDKKYKDQKQLWVYQHFTKSENSY